MDRAALKLEVVTPTRQVWSGDVVNIIARTTEGDIGILPGHTPLLAMLVPCAVEIITVDGRSEWFAVDRGFMSVSHGNVRLMTQQVVLSSEITLEHAYAEASALRPQREDGSISDGDNHRLRLLDAQIRAGERAHSQN
ncbi:MAG: F0F1 ATP synthase subunit epsilon [Arachnia sp.]